MIYLETCTLKISVLVYFLFVVFGFHYIEGHVDVVSFIANLEKTILHWMLED